ncbi:hypothetical protein [Sphingomicrobium flavum]|uniref:hypothetical protein n=1 Tax=Sphingomicrobium flavum TaxID=1229164 RepID=UPI0021ADC840|nr:hypothetical protein [Sphingomicrobium flavum]
MLSTLIVAALAQAAQPAPAPVFQPGTPQFEVQCMTALNQHAAQATDPQLRASLSTMALYYAARVDLLMQDDAQLTAAVKQSMDVMAGKALNTVSQACSQQMSARLGRFQRLAQQQQ